MRWMQGDKSVTPPGGEGNGWFLQRTCAAFEHVVDGMLRTQTKSAAIIAHGGTVMGDFKRVWAAAGEVLRTG